MLNPSIFMLLVLVGVVLFVIAYFWYLLHESYGGTKKELICIIAMAVVAIAMLFTALWKSPFTVKMEKKKLTVISIDPGRYHS